MHYIAINSSNQDPVVSLERVYEHLRISSPLGEVMPYDKDQVEIYLNAAVEYVEKYTGVPLLEKTVKMSYDNTDNPYGYQLKFYTNANEPTSIKYRDEAGELIDVSVATVFINNIKTPNEVVFKTPLPDYATNIIIEYEVTPVITPMAPAGMQAAILLLTAHLYDNKSLTGNEKFMLEINNILNVYKIKWHH
jgi:uncharacterized phiE125 gp8 family phage protein